MSTRSRYMLSVSDSRNNLKNSFIEYCCSGRVSQKEQKASLKNFSPASAHIQSFTDNRILLKSTKNQKSSKLFGTFSHILFSEHVQSVFSIYSREIKNIFYLITRSGWKIANCESDKFAVHRQGFQN